MKLAFKYPRLWNHLPIVCTHPACLHSYFSRVRTDCSFKTTYYNATVSARRPRSLFTLPASSWDRKEGAVFGSAAVSTSDGLISHLVGCMIVLKDGRRKLARQ